MKLRMVIRFRASASTREMGSIFTTWSAITGGVTSGIYNSITYAIDKNGEDPVGSESDGKFTVDMDHAKDNMAIDRKCEIVNLTMLLNLLQLLTKR